MFIATSPALAPQATASHPPCTGYEVPSHNSGYQKLVRELGKQADIVIDLEKQLNIDAGYSRSLNQLIESLGGTPRENAGARTDYLEQPSAFPAAKFRAEQAAAPIDLSGLYLGRNTPIVIDKKDARIEALEKFEQVQKDLAALIAVHNFPKSSELQALAVKDIMWLVPESSRDKIKLRTGLLERKHSEQIAPIGTLQTPEAKEFLARLEALKPHQRAGYLHSKYQQLSSAETALSPSTLNDYRTIFTYHGGVHFKQLADALVVSNLGLEKTSRIAAAMKLLTADKIYAVAPALREFGTGQMHEHLTDFGKRMLEHLPPTVNACQFVQAGMKAREVLISGNSTRDGLPLESPLAEKGLLDFSARASLILRPGRDLAILARLTTHPNFARDVIDFLKAGPFGGQVPS